LGVYYSQVYLVIFGPSWNLTPGLGLNLFTNQLFLIGWLRLEALGLGLIWLVGGFNQEPRFWPGFIF